MKICIYAKLSPKLDRIGKIYDRFCFLYPVQALTQICGFRSHFARAIELSFAHLLALSISEPESNASTLKYGVKFESTVVTASQLVISGDTGYTSTCVFENQDRASEEGDISFQAMNGAVYVYGYNDVRLDDD